MVAVVMVVWQQRRQQTTRLNTICIPPHRGCMIIIIRKIDESEWVKETAGSRYPGGGSRCPGSRGTLKHKFLFFQRAITAN